MAKAGGGRAAIAHGVAVPAPCPCPGARVPPLATAVAPSH
jgi:hypothetical protein